MDEEYIPGTVNIYSLQADDELGNRVRLKKDPKNPNIILNPQPTDSPNDPLNWNKWRKFWNLMVLAFITGFTAATSNDAGATQDDLNDKYGISYDSMNTGAGVLFIGIGWGAFFLTPFAYLYGRKLTYFICILLGLLGSVWFALLSSTSDTIWNQLFVGISESCAEAQVQLSLSDMYFQHQLGSVLTVYILATSVGTYLGPLIADFITQYCGFRWVGWVAVFISGGLLLVIVFAMDESVYTRITPATFLNAITSITDEKSNQVVEENEVVSKNSNREKLSINDSTQRDQLFLLKSNDGLANQASLAVIREEMLLGNLEGDEYQDHSINEPLKPYWKRVQMITLSPNLKGTGFKQYVKQLLMLTRVFIFPPVIYSGLVWGMQDALLTFYLTVEDDYYYDAPYNYGDTAVALMNIPCLIGAVIGCVYAGTVSDWFSIWLAKRNNGIQEAEYRLWFLLIPAFLAPVGLILFAVGTDEQWHWFPTYFGLALVGLGFGSSGDVSMSYLMDAYPDMVIEMMCGVAVINNMIGCIFTFACSPWLDAMGITHTFIILAVLEFVIMIASLPLIYYGKRIRKFTKKWYLDYCRVRDNL